jgi:F-type H+-transporting ATPase subunit delta
MISEIEKYVQNILQLVYRKDEFDQILFDLSLLNDRLGYSTLNRNLQDKPEDRKVSIKGYLKSIDSEILYNYLQGLLDQQDLWLFEPAHFKIFVEQMEESVQKMTVFNLTAAVELTDEDLKKLSDKLSKRLERKVVINISVDKTLIGGAIIKKDNYIMDYSLKTKLSTFGTQWKKAIQQAKDSNG